MTGSRVNELQTLLSKIFNASAFAQNANPKHEQEVKPAPMTPAPVVQSYRVKETPKSEVVKTPLIVVNPAPS